ncbi:tRNA uridine-5-carboxymethylaminomethyl(34) synthesis GTPase MnmE [Sphingosinithalassobacter sp. CS137]|uniref:tRNA uridine-5-carboxymethylaminomethyl(34) synthesis GTPase MnmE n=1 Tax=Sphingosinithalassobacter sp. CS137 TaxID=2762748 RepID=UPI00165E5534|nr:tRNA uridine-5-carboxymethylaminomethyl(34) synthesis GTPase MnmE [Sphingosinithalassobacter sp. CS137]
METIFAVSSGAPPAAIAVLRLSGADAFGAVESLVGALPEPRRASLRALRDPADGTLLDRALLLVFRAPHSATGEDLVELHLHGGRAVVRATEAVLGRMPGLRAAEPGEFTRRALANGRIDLSEAEGLGDLLMAETESQRRVALRAAEGGVRREVERWRMALLGLSAEIEAALDHSDEGDVADSTGSASTLPARAARLASEIEAAVARPPVERLRDGLHIVLAGPPNAGKSTLLNALAGREAAIVSPQAGTTRDRIEIPVVRDGTAYVLTDTAGLADATDDAIEAIGIARARTAIETADMLLWLGEDSPPPHPQVIWVHARADLAERQADAAAKDISVSSFDVDSVEALWALVGTRAGSLLPPLDHVALNARQRALLGEAAGALRAASREGDELIVAEHLRAGLRAFDAVTGRASTEAMLDSLFARFCIGK